MSQADILLDAPDIPRAEAEPTAPLSRRASGV